jgi:hypothetical protein
LTLEGPNFEAAASDDIPGFMQASRAGPLRKTLPPNALITAPPTPPTSSPATVRGMKERAIEVLTIAGYRTYKFERK